MAVGATGSAIEAGQAFVTLGINDKEFRDKLDKARDKFMKFGGMIKNIGLGIAGIGSTILGSLGLLAFSTLKYIDSLQDVADRTDSSIESVSRLAYAAKLSAVSMETLEEANKKLNASTVAAINGNEDLRAAFVRMGITAKDFAKLDIDERFKLIAETADRLGTPIAKTQFLIALLGESSAKVLPLLKDGAEGLNKLFTEAESVGAVIRKDDGRKAADAMDAFDKVLTSLKSTFVELGLAVFEAFGDLKEGQNVILLYLKMTRDWIKENKKLVTIILIVGAVLVAVGTALVVAGIAVGGLTAGFVGLITVVGAVVAVLSAITPAGIAITAAIAAIIVVIGALIYAFFKFTKAGQNVVAIWVSGFNDIKESFNLTWSGILGALRKGDFELAWKIVTYQAYIIFKQFIVSMQITWNEFLSLFIEAFTKTISILRILFSRITSFIIVGGLGALKIFIDETTKLLDKLGAVSDLVASVAKEMKGLSGTIQTKIDAEVKAQADKETKIVLEENKIDDAFRKWQGKGVEEQKKEIKNLIDFLKDLEKQANKPVVAEPALPLAPRPREKTDIQLGQLGDSTRGLFDSADFKASLGIGNKNDYARTSVDLQSDMLKQLQEINRKTGVEKFN